MYRARDPYEDQLIEEEHERHLNCGNFVLYFFASS